MEPNDKPSLGTVLKQRRDIEGFTLRQVEEVTGISNAYLSQLENDKIKKPSASVLYKLACIYKIELTILLFHAGIIDSSDTHYKAVNGFAGIPLTDEEQKELLKYLQFLRHGTK